MSKKVLLVCSGGFIGGAEKLMLGLGQLFAADGMTVGFALNGDGEVSEKLDALVIGKLNAKDYLSKWNPFPYFLNLLKALKMVRKFSPDVILVEGKILTQVFAVVGKLSGIKVISYVHFPICDYEAKRLYYSLTHKIVLCAQGLKKYFKKSGLADEHFISIRNAVDADIFHPVEKQKKLDNLAENAFVISLVGHLSQVKGQKHALRAMVKLKAAGHDVHLLLAGADNHPEKKTERELKTLARQLDVESNVSFLGKVSNVTGIYHSSDILLLPSAKEGLPLVVLEAMACGLPVVATAVDGTPDAVIDGETGFLLDQGELEAGNIEFLVEKIEHLLQDRELREKMSTNARNRAIKEFSKAKYESEFLELVRNS